VPVRRSRFEQPVSPQRRKAANRFEQFSPLAGVNYDVAPQLLRPNQASDLVNFNIHDGYIEPRSGLSMLVASSGSATTVITNSAAIISLHAGDAKAVVGTNYGVLVALSTKTALTISSSLEIRQTSDGTYTFDIANTPPPLTNVVSSAGTPYVVFGGNYVHGGVPLFEIDITNGGISSATLASLDDLASVSTGAFQGLEFFDQRLCVFHTWDTSNGVHANRLWYSQRGNVLSFTSGGFEDLNEMQGKGTGLVKEEDRLLLFSDKEVWTATPRRDAYAFDFNPLNSEVGCAYHTAAVPTPAGTFFLNATGLYRAKGNRVSSVDLGVKNVLSSFSRNPYICFVTYNEARRSIMVFYNTVYASSGANSAIEARIDTIRQLDEERDQMVWEKHSWPDYAFQCATSWSPDYAADPWLVLGGHNGKLYFLDSLQTTDQGSKITAYYRSPLVPAEFPFGSVAPNEAWVETMPSTSTATVQVLTSANAGGTFTSWGNTSTSSLTKTTFVPIGASASRYAQVELRVTDGSKPRIARLGLRLRDYTGRFRG